MKAQTCNPSIHKAEDSHEFKANLGYKVSESYATMNYTQDPVSKKKSNNHVFSLQVFNQK